ncbi:3-hydroxyacyl-CoA dehydrogenase NAD-binding domain-containing protein [Acuticoccus sp. MNP-M23]|uniref:3-hydroxyacyl-CoA dehydrogenase NAD-binding domain-containing protein n=1 Tax=Acuticoccus sp. MNP-M23 TaxID=3072793 RepID=UPI0028150065|nr:3-hydroxyacyl-CoA dehydrogenase NAD-binding domain-containing protein [Acuticoccus sp. MNP-M23]WMS42548.1 3-hydroxyacyl-CoA dehydrogenase NAD-binding domain-containing protein [Acuticoccus sp. MNP-M23]
MQSETADRTTICVIGAGLMGHGIAWLFAANGYDVALHDPVPEALAAAPERLAAISSLLGKGEGAPARVRLCAELADAAAGAAFVFEAAPEKLPLKREIFAALERHAPADAILASNTSALPISAICDGFETAHRMVGTHFWNPPHLVPLVEVIEVEGINGDAIGPTMAVLEAVGRHPVHVRKDVPGFIGNRLHHALKREAMALIADGVCDAKTIDDVVKLGFGRRMSVLGPMEQCDLVGLELTADIQATIAPALDNTAGIHPALQAHLDAGHLGMRSGQGFRHWGPGEADAVRERLSRFLAEQARESES